MRLVFNLRHVPAIIFYSYLESFKISLSIYTYSTTTIGSLAHRTNMISFWTEVGQ